MTKSPVELRNESAEAQAVRQALRDLVACDTGRQYSAMLVGSAPCSPTRVPRGPLRFM